MLPAEGFSDEEGGISQPHRNVFTGPQCGKCWPLVVPRAHCFVLLQKLLAVAFKYNNNNNDNIEY